ALMLAPARFTPETAIYLGLKTAHARLSRARQDEALREVVDYLWEIAVRIEDGDLSQTARDLRAAQEALRQALERGASEEEIRRLTEELRAALDRHLREMAEQMRRNPDMQAPVNPNARMVRPQDLQRMIDQMEQFAQRGAREEAQRMLDELQRLLENLQT